MLIGLKDHYSNFTTQDKFNAFVEEVKTNVGSGNTDGAPPLTFPENYYGVAAAMTGKMADHNGLSNRDGVPFYQILVADDCALTGERADNTEGTIWEPPLVADLTSVLGDGSVTIHGVYDSGDVCGSDYLSIGDIVAETGGASLERGTGNVDLSAINLADFITNFWLVTVDSTCVSGTVSFVMDLEIRVEDAGEIRTQTITFSVTLANG